MHEISSSRRRRLIYNPDQAEVKGDLRPTCLQRQQRPQAPSRKLSKKKLPGGDVDRQGTTRVLSFTTSHPGCPRCALL